MTRLLYMLLSATYLMLLTVRYAVWMPKRWARLAMLGLFLAGGIGGVFAAHNPIPHPRPIAPLPEIKSDMQNTAESMAAAWNALAAAEERLARKLREESGR